MRKITQCRLFNLLLNDEFDIQHKLQNSVLAISLAGNTLSTIISFACGFNMIGNIINLIATILILISLYISVIKRKKEPAFYLVSITTNLIIFPTMFFFNGGLYSGMPIWYAFGLVYPWMLVKGKPCYILFGLNLVSSLTTIAIQVFYPETVILPASELDFAVDVAQSIVTVSIILGLTVKYQGYVYEQQNKQIKQKDEELSNALQAAADANLAKSSFLVNMSHEIRTPINAVLGMDEMILRESDDDVIIGYAVNIQSAGQSLLSIINDVLDLSKIESGKMEILPSEYDLAKMLNDCYNMIIIRAEKKNLKLIEKNDVTTPKILLGDEVRVRQIVINLLTNAVKYTTKGQIILQCGYDRIDDNHINLKISVKDTGTGISEENQKHLFESFKRVDEIKNRNIEGTGLGLNITKQLIDLMGGTISVESELGKGSTFSIVIPQTVISNEEIGDLEAYSDRFISGKKQYHEKFQAPDAHILVVDDVKLNVDVIKGLLKKTKVQCDAAYSGKECLGLARKNSYDIIFMDHLMPEMDGVETLKNLKMLSDSPNSKTPVIALTANAIAGAREKYTALGFSDYLSKPIKSDSLEDMLLQYLPSRLVTIIENDPAEKPLHAESAKSHEVLSGDALNTELGIFYCCNDEAFYHKILTLFIEDTKIQQLNEAFAKKDWKSYELLCCSVKSASMNIGAEAFSNLMRNMEKELKLGNTGYIIENHDNCTSCYRQLIQNIKEQITNMSGGNR